MNNFSDDTVNEWLNGQRSCWVSLHFQDPYTGGEVNGGSYTRASATFTAASGRVIWLSKDLVWGGLPAFTLTHYAGWDKQYGGSIQWASEAQNVVSISQGSWTLPQSSLALSIN